MAHFAKIQTTQQGKNIILAGQNKQSVVFTKVELGDGLLDEGQSVDDMTALVHSVMSLPLQNFVNNGDGTARLRFVLDNNNLSKGFFNREIGVFAKVGDGTEQLFAYTNAGNLADYIPGKESPISSKIINLHIIVGNAADLTIVAENSAYVTKLDMDGHKTQEVLDHPDGSVTTPKLRDEAVTGTKIAQASIEKKHLKKGGISAEDVGAYSKGETDEKITAHRTAAELDHPEKSVHKKHLHQDAYESPALTGTPTAPTAGRGTNNGQIASTAFVAQAMIDTKNACVPKDAYRDAFLVRAGDGISDNISSILSGIALTKEDRSKPYPFNANGHLLVKVNGDRDILFVDETGAIRLFSTGSLFQVNTDAVFKKSPTAPTPPSGSNNTQLATTEFVALAKTGIVASNLAENGWVKFANGLILQWGIVKNGSGTQRVSFPISFSSKVFHINFSSTILSNDAITNSSVQSYSLTGAELYANTSPAGYVLWFAIGI